jgi:ABC-type polysaccharide/polyol phosphate transport system ATPase subunit
MAEAAITVDDVAKSFRLVHERNSTLKATVLNGFRRTVHEEFWALQDISFEIPEGSTFGLIGHNGSGKSTLLKCIARIYRPNRGSITTRGRLSALLELGAGFHPELSGRENVFLNGSILGLSRREVEQRFDGIVEFAGLEKFIDTPVKNYSSGMYIRLGFSVAITVEPDILVVDEVLAVGDEEFQRKCLEKFADIRASGRTIVLVSHGLEAVRNICDRVAWFDSGHLMKEGRAGEIVDAYLDSVREERRSHDHERSLTEAIVDDGWSIGSIDLLGPDGSRADLVRSRDPLTISASLGIGKDEPTAFVMNIYRSDGVHVAGSVHRFDPSGAGRITVDYTIERCSLAAGVYDISVHLMDEHLERAHAERPKAVRFDVLATHDDDHMGIVALGGTWSVRPGGPPT